MTSLLVGSVQKASDNHRQNSQKASCVLLFGAPGSGKGTIGKALGALPGVFHCSSGDILRASISRNSCESETARQIASGGLVSDAELWQRFDEFLDGQLPPGFMAEAANVLLLDGIPRSVSQCDQLFKRMHVGGVLYLECADVRLLIKRLLRRFEVSGRSDDGIEDSIQTRLRVFHEHTLPVLTCFPTSMIHRVDAALRPECVLLEVLKQYRNIRTEMMCRFATASN